MEIKERIIGSRKNRGLTQFETANKAGIDFAVEKVTVGSVNEDSWDKAFNRLYRKLKDMRNTIRARLNSRRDD